MKKLSFWKALFVLILIAGAYSTYLRFFKGLGASTNLSDEFPWGIWIGFDALCGIMLAAGGFTLMAFVYVLNLDKYKPIARAALITAFLGYLLEVFALMFDLGKPYNIWHPLIMWNPRSPMFLVGWCVMLYTTIMALEFAPLVFERLRPGGPRSAGSLMAKARRILRWITTPLVMLGVIVSVLHQSALGMLYLIVPGKLHPLWYTSMLPVLFFVSAIAAGIAMTIFESAMSARHFDHALEKPLVLGLGRALLVMLIIYAVLRLENLFDTGNYKFAFQGGREASLFWVEIALAIVIPITLLLIRKVRENPIALYVVSIVTVAGFMLNRLNVAVTGMERWAGVRYIPKWNEVSVTLMVISVGIVGFTLIIKYLRIFEHPTTGHA
jgi:Ni/Fe-hydrogenase subunit HybB-like protein